MPSLPSSPPLRALARHDGTLAATLGAVLLAAGMGGRGLPWPDALGATLLCVPLAWRTRSPLAVLAAVTLGSFAFLALTEPSQVFVLPAMVALYTVAAHGWRRRTLAVAAAMVPVAVVIALVFSPDDGGPLEQVIGLLSQLAIALAIGEAVRSQRALFRAMRERAERAEREQELEARRRVGEERVRIARDVHDVVAHSLATVSTQASVGVHVGRQEPERAVEVLEIIKEVSTGALHDLRYALGALRDDPADVPSAPAPSMQDLPALVGQARGSGLPVVLRMQGSPAALPAAMQLAIYRIVQEGLTNVMRHAGGAQAMVRIAVDRAQVEVEVTNDGAGRPTAAADAGSGSGLVGMRERASALGGVLEAGPAAGGGFQVRAVLPLATPAPA